MENKKSDDPMPFAIGMGGLVAVAVISQKQEQIKYWLYDHLMLLVFAAFILVALLVMRVLSKIKKKDGDMLARMRAVKSVQPGKAPAEYYKRRNR